MEFLRNITRLVLRPVLRSPLQVGIGDQLTSQVKTLFSNGEKGVMFDFSKASNLYTDSARTTLVSASGDGVGSATDLSPNAKHASSNTTKRPLWNNGGYVTFDAFDDFLQTAAVDFSGTDKITVVVSARKSTDTTAIIVELSASASLNAGSFYAATHDTGGREWSAAARGTATLAAAQSASDTTLAPDTAVITSSHDIAGDLSTIRRNGIAGTNGTGDKGSGNFGNYPLNIGARNAISVFFNGRIYRIFVIGRALTATERSLVETWAALPAGIVLP